MRVRTGSKRSPFSRSLESWIIGALGERAALTLILAVIGAGAVGGQVIIGSDALWIAAGAVAFTVVGHRSAERTIFLWAALLRIDHVGWLAMRVPDGWRAVGIAFVAYRITATNDRLKVLAPWVALAAGTVGIRMIWALGTDDRTAFSVTVTLSAAVIAATIAVIDRRSTLPLLAGLATGATASGAVAILQMSDVARFTTAPEWPLRFPGMAGSTTALSWHLAVGLIALFIVRSRRAAAGERAAIHTAMAVVVIALIGCGSQGGLVAVAAAGVLAAIRLRGRSSVRPTRATVLVSAMVILGVVVLATTSSIDGFPPEKGFANDIARLDVVDDALEAIWANPLAGPGYTDFGLTHGIQPHVLPLQLGVAAGVVGLLLGMFAVVVIIARAWSAWRRSDRAALPGAALTTVLVLWMFVEPAGPFGSDFGMTTLLLVAVLTATTPGVDPPPPQRVDNSMVSTPP